MLAFRQNTTNPRAAYAQRISTFTSHPSSHTQLGEYEKGGSGSGTKFGGTTLTTYVLTAASTMTHDGDAGRYDVIKSAVLLRLSACQLLCMSLVYTDIASFIFSLSN